MAADEIKVHGPIMATALDKDAPVSAWRPVRTGPTGREIVRFLDSGEPFTAEEGIVLLERGLVNNGTKAPGVSWAPPADGSVRLDGHFWLHSERVNTHQPFMAFGVPEAEGPPVVEVVDDGPMPVLAQPPQPVLPAAETTRSEPIVYERPTHLSRVMAPEEVGRRVVADLLSDVEHHGTALVKALDEAIDPPSLPGTPRFVLADGSVRVLQTVRAEVEAVLAQLPNWGADPS